MGLVCALLCLTFLTGCEETEKLAAEESELQNKMAALQAENADMEQKLVTLRRTMPPGTSPEEVAKTVAAKAAADLKYNQEEVVKLAQRYAVTEGKLKALKVEVETLRQSTNP